MDTDKFQTSKRELLDAIQAEVAGKPEDNRNIVTRTNNPSENLCDTCQKEIPECDADEGLLEYGNKKPACDNVVGCGAYVSNIRSVTFDDIANAIDDVQRKAG